MRSWAGAPGSRMCMIWFGTLAQQLWFVITPRSDMIVSLAWRALTQWLQLEVRFRAVRVELSD